MSEIVHHETQALALQPEQTRFTSSQVAALQHMGVENASPGDLEVFFHRCQRSGLDPFAKQIYMIGREVSERQRDGSYRKVTKQTIQTGIDGYRLIGHRSANRAHVTLSVSAAEWAHEDGSWRPVWSRQWGLPVAARVTITRGTDAFVGVALFDEYQQTKRDGSLNQMWAQRPAGQIAKCAEALAWRKAFPEDTSGIYTDDEVNHDRPAAIEPPRSRSGLAKVLTATVAPTEPEPESPTGEMLDTGSNLAKRMFACMNEAGIRDREDRLGYCVATIGRPIESSSEMTTDDARLVIDSFVNARGEGEQ